MSYHTLLLHVDKSPNAEERIRLAAELAQRQRGHLIGTAMTGIPRFMSGGSVPDLAATLFADYVRMAAQRADHALLRFNEITRQLGVDSCEQRRSNDDEYTALCLQARYADIVILGQADPQDHGSGGLLLDLPEHVALHCGRPVLLVPHAGSFRSLGQHALIAWNGSVEAARATAAALPILRHAAKVTVVLFDARTAADAHGEEPGADIAWYLARHGLQVKVVRRPGPIDAGHALLSFAADIGADLLVMGCYGHSRFSETLLGGVTRTVLANMSIPVLMAH